MSLKDQNCVDVEGKLGTMFWYANLVYLSASLSRNIVIRIVPSINLPLDDYLGHCPQGCMSESKDPRSRASQV
jgi:hypothetical protein